MATELELPDAPRGAARWPKFGGVGRRFQRYGEVNAGAGAGTFTLIDDYGHHSVEMAAVLARRAAPSGQRIVLAFQLHSRWSAHARLFEDFVKVMGSADVVLLAVEVHAAGEAPTVVSRRSAR